MRRRECRYSHSCAKAMRKSWQVQLLKVIRQSKAYHCPYKIYSRTEQECTHNSFNNEARRLSPWLGMIYRHVSKSYEMRQEQVESVWDETNVPFQVCYRQFARSPWEPKNMRDVTCVYGLFCVVYVPSWDRFLVSQTVSQ